MSEWSDRESDAREEGEDLVGETGGIDAAHGEEGGQPEPMPGEGGGGAMAEESYRHDLDEAP